MNLTMMSMLLMVSSGVVEKQMKVEDHVKNIIGRLCTTFARTDVVKMEDESFVVFWANPETERNPTIVVRAAKEDEETTMVTIHRWSFEEINLAKKLFEKKWRKSSFNDTETMMLHRSRSISMAEEVYDFLAEEFMQN